MLSVGETDPSRDLEDASALQILHWITKGLPGAVAIISPILVAQIFGRPTTRFDQLQTRLQLRRNSEIKCNRDFALVGTNADTVRAYAAEAEFFDGTIDSTTLQDLYVNSPIPGVRQGGSSKIGTVADDMAAHPGIVAEAELGSHRIFLNYHLISPRGFSHTAVVLHELLHNISGLTDSDLQPIFSTVDKNVMEENTTNNITLHLIRDCY